MEPITITHFHSLLNEAGYNSPSQFSKINNLNPNAVNKIAYNHASPFNQNTYCEFKKTVLEIAGALQLEPDELFTPEQLCLLDDGETPNVFYIVSAADEMLTKDGVNMKYIYENIFNILFQNLSMKQGIILSMKIGLFGLKKHTPHEIKGIFGFLPQTTSHIEIEARKILMSDQIIRSLKTHFDIDYYEYIDDVIEQIRHKARHTNVNKKLVSTPRKRLGKWMTLNPVDQIIYHALVSPDISNIYKKFQLPEPHVITLLSNKFSELLPSIFNKHQKNGKLPLAIIEQFRLELLKKMLPEDSIHEFLAAGKRWSLDGMLEIIEVKK